MHEDSTSGPRALANRPPLRMPEPQQQTHKHETTHRPTICSREVALATHRCRARQEWSASSAHHERLLWGGGRPCVGRRENLGCVVGALDREEESSADGEVDGWRRGGAATLGGEVAGGRAALGVEEGDVDKHRRGTRWTLGGDFVCVAIPF
ncbi:hypothetical protein ZWY2020_013718 [Hordeum vulgare]|nr:hypothetical protein ZWY2020_013718 [Hordeum vulgare]